MRSLPFGLDPGPRHRYPSEQADQFPLSARRDIWSAQRVAMERPDVSYRLLAVDFLSHAALHASMLRLSTALATGVFGGRQRVYRYFRTSLLN